MTERFIPIRPSPGRQLPVVLTRLLQVALTRLLPVAIVLLLPVALSLLLVACGKQRTSSPPSPAGRSSLVLLGTGTPNAEPDRSGPALAVVVDSFAYLVDAGPGVVRRANAAYERGVAALAPERLDRLFLTHLHSDHTLGYPDVIFTSWTLGRDHPIEVWGPPGTRAMTEHILAAWREDVANRTGGLEPANPWGWRVTVHEIDPGAVPGVIHADERVRVTAFPVKHGNWERAFGFRFDTPDRVFVVSGDTVPVESLIEHARGCDVLVHEVFSQAGFERRAPEWQRYHAASHTSAPDLARIAQQVHPGVLVLTHQLLWGATPEELLAEITALYDGPVYYGRDLEIY